MMRVVLAITLVAVALLGAEAMPMEEEVTTLLQEEANPAGAAAAADPSPAWPNLAPAYPPISRYVGG